MLSHVEIEYSRALIAKAEVRLEHHKATMPGGSDDAHLADLSLLTLMEARLVMMRGQHDTLVSQQTGNGVAAIARPTVPSPGACLLSLD